MGFLGYCIQRIAEDWVWTLGCVRRLRVKFGKDEDKVRFCFAWGGGEEGMNFSVRSESAVIVCVMYTSATASEVP